MALALDTPVESPSHTHITRGDGSTVTLLEAITTSVLPASAGGELRFSAMLLGVILLVTSVMHALRWRIALPRDVAAPPVCDHRTGGSAGVTTAPSPR